MKASPRQQQLLLDLQSLDNTGAQFRRKRSSLPERAEFDAVNDEAEAAKSCYMEAQRELDAQNAELARIEADVKLVEDRRARDEGLLATSTSPKEAQSLQGEMETLARRQRELEDRELEVMETQESAQAAFSEAESVLAGVDGRRAEIAAKIEAAERELDAQIAAAAEERAGIAAEIQRELVELYEELRGRIGIGAARLNGKVSEASNMELAPAELSDIMAAAPDELVFCPQSGAILVHAAADTA